MHNKIVHKDSKETTDVARFVKAVEKNYEHTKKQLHSLVNDNSYKQ